MEQKNNPKEIPEALEALEESQEKELEETNEIIICTNCNKEQVKIIIVSICEAKESLWYKCSETSKCPLFQNKNKNK
jgi:hypothetical protein